jgi:hypothetical protein
MAICCQTARLVKERFERSSRCWLAEGSVGGECLAVDVGVTVADAHRPRASRRQINSILRPTGLSRSISLSWAMPARSRHPDRAEIISSVDPGPGDGTGGRGAEGPLSDA